MTVYLFFPDGSADIRESVPHWATIDSRTIMCTPSRYGDNRMLWRTADNWTLPDCDPRITKEMRLKLLLLKG